MKLSQTDKDTLKNIYEHDKLHIQRQKAHCILLNDKGLSNKDIAVILDLSYEEITSILSTWNVLQKDVFTSNEISFAPKTTTSKPSFFSLENFFNIPYRNYYRADNKISSPAENHVKINKGNGNMIFQLNFHGDNGETQLKEIETKNRNEVAKVLEEILSSKKNYKTSDKILPLVSALKDRIENVENQAKKQKYMNWLIFFGSLFIYHTSLITFIFKGVIVFIGLITICISNGINIVNSNELAQSEKLEHESCKDTSEVNITPLIGKTDSLFAPLPNCEQLTGITDKQLNMIDIDTISFRHKDYFIDSIDNNKYIHVAIYEDVRRAIFQRLYLLKNGFNNVKIIQKKKRNRNNLIVNMYYVTIANYHVDKKNEIENWNKACKGWRNKNNKAGIIHNN